MTIPTIFPLLPLLLLFFQFILPNTISAAASPASQFISCINNNTRNQPNLIFSPQNPFFTQTLQAYIQNSRFNRSTTPKPIAIITASNYSHVQSAVLCSKSSGIQLRIRSGGHDFEGLSYMSSVPFAILDMFKLRALQIDVGNRVAWVQAGAILGEVYYNVAKKSNNTLAFPAGVCLTLGAGGHISGGGYGPLIRKYGLSVDNILDAQVVDAKGRILNRASMGEDFFWAIRGGGAASFGVVLSWKLRLVPIPQTITVFSVRRTLEEGATDIIFQWQNVAPNMDPGLFIRAQPQPISGTKTTVGVSFIAQYMGGAKEMLRLVNKSFPLLGLKLKDCVEMSWAQSTLFWASGSPKGTPLEQMLVRSPSSSNNYGKHKSDYVNKPIPKTGWEAIWKKMIELGPNVLMQYNPYGGRMSEIASDATPFPHRAGNLFKMQYITFWSDASIATEDTFIKATRDLYNTFTPFVSQNPRESFLNYRDIDVGTNVNGGIVFANDFFKGNVPRLVKLKSEVDPGNLFKYEQSIPLKT